MKSYPVTRHPTLFAPMVFGSLLLILGGAFITPGAEAYPGQWIDRQVVSESKNPTGVSYGLNDNVSWMTDQGHIYQNRDLIYFNFQTIITSLWPEDSWKFLAERVIGDHTHFLSLNKTTNHIYIRSTAGWSDYSHWEYPGDNPEYIGGLAFTENGNVLVHNQSGFWKKFEEYTAQGSHIRTIVTPLNVYSGKGIVVNENDGSILMNRFDDSQYWAIWTSGTEYVGHDAYSYSSGPLTNMEFTDATHDPVRDIFYVSENVKSLPSSLPRSIVSYRGPRRSPTPTPTVTPTPVPTSTPPPTLTPTVTPSPSVTPTPTPEGYKTPSPSPTPSTSPTPEPTPVTPEAVIGIFRPSSGLWAIRGLTRAYFGSQGDTPVYQDYSGDGTGDLAIFRPNSGLWAIRGVTRVYFGTSNDQPVPSDYTGDGTSDIAIFRESSGLWAVRGFTRAYFGTTGDVPVPGDYTGDGTEGLAIFRPSSGLWAVRGITRVYFGTLNDIPIPRDYTGDGTRDIGIFRGASGLWAIRGVTRSYFGGALDLPVPGDYSGDGTDDLGVFRETSGLWAIRGVTRTYFGTVGDVPVTR